MPNQFTMNLKKLFIYPLLVSLLFLLHSCSNSSPKDLIQNHWVTEQSFLIVKGSNSIVTNINGTELNGRLNWLNDSTIQIIIPEQNKTFPIDSMASFHNELGEITITYYYNNEVVCQQINGDLQRSEYIYEYQINQIDEKELVLTDSKNDQISFTSYVEEAVIESNFSIMSILRGALGILFLLSIAFLFSSNRKKINWRLVGMGVSLQIILAILVLKVPFVKSIFDVISKGFVTVLNFTKDGSAFLFGNLVTDIDSMGFIFAFQILPTIVFFAALSSALYYLGIIQWIVYFFAWIMSKTMKLSGAESLAAAGNIFLGQTESPLLVRPYLQKMTRSEIMCLMTGGMATIAGGVLGAYVGYLGGDSIQEQQIFASHLLAASIMSAPAAIVAAKMLVPEDNNEAIDHELSISKEKIGANVLDAISTGTRDGLKLAVNVGVMLLVFTAFMYMFNAISLQIGEWTHLNEKIVIATNGRFEGLSLQYILGMIFSPIAWLLGVDWKDAVLVGQLLGEKTILNEFFAYASLGKLKAANLFLNNKSIVIATYALCGFANFASIGIQIGGISALAPNQQSTLAKLGIKSLIGGTIACFMTATIAGMLF